MKPFAPAFAGTASTAFRWAPRKLVHLRAWLFPDEGKKDIGAKNVTTNVNGNTSIFTLKPQNKVPAGQTITATSNSTGDTSEFSESEEVA